MASKQTLIAVTLGDPTGIGPEVACKAVKTCIAEHNRSAHTAYILIGAASEITRYLPQASDAVSADKVKAIALASEYGLAILDDPEYKPPASIDSAQSGAASYRWVTRSIELLASGQVAAVTTGPISKHAWMLAGHTQFPGHTEMFAAAAPQIKDRFAMFFHAPPQTQNRPGLNVILTTIHIPLAKVPSAVTTQRVYETISLAHETMQRLGVTSPRIGVCGLNPHAGEQGLLGTEDERNITPAVQAAIDAGMCVSGPHPADTIFQRALAYVDRPAQSYDCVVAMYHDQGLVPLKTLAWDRAVNMTVGLPFIRTSPDHGTAFDIAGKNRADPGSMIAAIELAAKLAKC